MYKVLTAVAIMAFATPSFAADDMKKAADSHVKNILVLVSTNTKTGESTSSIIHKDHKKAHDDHAVTLGKWSSFGKALAKGAKATAKGAKKAGQLAYKHKDKIAEAGKTGLGLAVTGVGVAQMLGGKVDENHPAWIAAQMANQVLNGEDEE